MTVRTKETIHQQYSELCARAGHVAYTILVYQEDLAKIQAELKALNLEAAALQVEAPSAEVKGA